VVAFSAGLSELMTAAPLMPALVLASFTVPTTSPPGVGSQLRLSTEKSSTSHHQPKLPVKWNRTCTAPWPPACGRAASSRLGPRLLSLPWCQALVQVAPPSVVTSTSPTWLGKPL